MANNKIEINCARDLGKLKGITYGALNVRSLFRHKEEIEMLLMRSQLDILLLSETFLNYSVNNNLMEIKGYNFFRMDRDGGSGKKGGGGLCVYSRPDYKVTHLTEKNLCTPDIEIMWLCFDLKDTRKTFIANVYRPPDGNMQNFTEMLELQTLDLYTDGNPDSVIMGDTNIDLLKRNTNTKKYKDCLHTLQLNQLLTEPTRLTELHPS